MQPTLVHRTCRAALRLQVCRLKNVVTLQAVGRVCVRRASEAAASTQRCGVIARVAGIQDIPTTSTPLPPLGGTAPASQPDDDYVVPPPEEWAHHDLLMAGCEPGKQLNVAVLLSGGVDSSLALRLLKAAGHTCRAFYLQIWFQEDFRNFWDTCPWEEDLQYARQVCDSLGVPLEVVPLTTEYWDRVVSSSVDEIRAGRTPNPDMWCNSRVKFGAFYDYLDRTYGAAFDRVASGHYARVERGPRASAVGQQCTTSASDPGVQQQQHHHPHHAGCECGETGGTEARTEVEAPPDDGASALAREREPEEAAAAARRLSHAAASTSGGLEAGRGRHATAAAAGGPGAGGAREAVEQQQQQQREEQREHGDDEEVRLMLTPDAVKDQTYFLANLSPRQLARVMFPLGCLTKSQVRKLAAAADLANKYRKDSQGICFLGKVKFHEFVREHLGEWPGPILEAETGQPLGLHAGYWFYTVGQRGGIKLPGGPWYVVAKDTLRNAVLVSRQYYDADKQRNTFTCGPFNWLHPGARPDPRLGPLYVKVRHGPNKYRCALRLHDGHGDGASGDDSYGTVVLEQNDQGLAAGQYAVFYQGGRCLGCAVIQSTSDSAAAAAAAAAAGSDGLVPATSA